MVLNRTTQNFFAENEQIALGTGVLVDGLDYSDERMLVGRTFSYSDTQRDVDQTGENPGDPVFARRRFDRRRALQDNRGLRPELEEEAL
jgi:hypothetical protein